MLNILFPTFEHLNYSFSDFQFNIFHMLIAIAAMKIAGE